MYCQEPRSEVRFPDGRVERRGRKELPKRGWVPHGFAELETTDGCVETWRYDRGNKEGVRKVRRPDGAELELGRYNRGKYTPVKNVSRKIAKFKAW